MTDAAGELNVDDSETAPAPAIEESPSAPSPAPISADDDLGQQLGKKKKKKKGKKGAGSAAEEISVSHEPVPPAEETSIPEVRGGIDAPEKSDQPVVAVDGDGGDGTALEKDEQHQKADPEARGAIDALEKSDQLGVAVPEIGDGGCGGGGDGAALEKDGQLQIADPGTPASDDTVLEKGGQVESSTEDPLTVPTGKKSKKGKKGKKKGGSVDESNTPETTPVTDEAIESKPVDDLVMGVIADRASESPQHASESPQPLSDSNQQLSDSHQQLTNSPPQLSESPLETQAPGQSAPDTTTGADESSSAVLESVLSGKKGKKKKKKSVSFAELPPIADSTVSPMPEKEDDSTDAPVETRTEKDGELDRSLSESWDDAWDITAPGSSQAPPPEVAPSSDAPVEESELPSSPKSKKKKKKGKALEDLTINSDADVSSPPTPTQESLEFPAAESTAGVDTTTST
ncbi:hypothetical protein IMZ48_09110, partial [Candidatus Bathyarchaeota archaeon]|nr:hypothetical protein [Candidatus Bathyarchaeota archaeon]